MKDPVAYVSFDYPPMALGNRIFCDGVSVLYLLCPALSFRVATSHMWLLIS